MSELVIVKKSDMVAVADAVRRNSDTTEPMTLGEIIEGIDEIGASGITPEGTIEITENGTYDVTSYASATVDVGGGESDVLLDIDDYLMGNRDDFDFEITSNATSVKKQACNAWSSITKIDFPLAETLGDHAFNNCYNLHTVNLPNVKKCEYAVYYGCRKLISVNMPKTEELGNQAFASCVALSFIDLPSVEKFGSDVFQYGYSLKTLVLRYNGVVSSSGNPLSTNVHFNGTVMNTYNPNGDKDGYIYVPRAWIEDYKVATNWTVYASQFRALEDYTVDGTITGELDETKI